MYVNSSLIFAFTVVHELSLTSTGYILPTNMLLICYICITGTVAQWLSCCGTNRKVAGSIPAGVSGFFTDKKSFRLHYGPGVDSVSNRNEYLQEYFLGVKSASA